MARFDAHHPRTGAAAPRGGLGGLACGALAACILLVAPVVIWARFGAGGVVGDTAVALVAIAICWLVLRRTLRRYVRRRLPALERLAPAQTSWSPSSYRGHGRPRPASSRTRRTGATPHPCAARRCSAVYVSRFPRDVGCRASGRLTRSRGVRRRTRP